MSLTRRKTRSTRKMRKILVVLVSCASDWPSPESSWPESSLCRSMTRRTGKPARKSRKNQPERRYLRGQVEVRAKAPAVGKAVQGLEGTAASMRGRGGACAR